MRVHAPAIQYFQAAWRARSIRSASRTLNVAASAINRQIIKLEEEIGSPLFERTSRGLVLTPVGEIFARHVVVVSQDLQRARSEIQAVFGARIGHIKIATVEALCAELLPDVVSQLRARAPRVTLSIQMMGSGDIPRAVIEGEADIGLAFALRRNPRLHQIALTRFKLGAVVPSDHPLASHKSTTLAACLSYPLILGTSDLGISEILTPLFSKLPQPPEAAVQANSIELMRQLTLAGVGISFLTTFGVSDLVKSGRLVHVPLDAHGPVWSDLGVYIRAGRTLPALADVFVHALLEALSAAETSQR